MMRNKINKILEELVNTPLIGTRFTLGLAELIWAISLIFPVSLFNDNVLYWKMSYVANEYIWSGMFLTLFLVQWGIIIFRKYDSIFALVFSFIDSFIWWFICILIYTSAYPPKVAISGELALAFASSWVVIRMRVSPIRSSANKGRSLLHERNRFT